MIFILKRPELTAALLVMTMTAHADKVELLTTRVCTPPMLCRSTSLDASRRCSWSSC